MAHANLGASNSAIWLACAEAGRKMRQFKSEGKPSPYAAQGTVAHGIVEIGALFGMDALTPIIGTTETIDGFDIEIDQKMIDAVAVYVDYIDKITLPTDTRYLEERVSLDQMVYGSTHVYEALFGTADCIIVSDDGLEVNVVDYKHGAGVPVEADTTQGIYYGAGAVYRFAPNAQIVTVTIVQPRAPHPDGPIRTKSYTRLDVENFIERVRKSVKDILSGAGGYVSGKHCRFCPMSGACPELHKTNLAVARGEFMDNPPANIPPTPGLLTGDQLSHVLDNKDTIKRWLDAVEQEAIRRLSNNDPVKDYKMVAKRARKGWAYGDHYMTLAAARREIGGQADMLRVDDIVSPAKAKDKLPPQDYQALVDANIIESVSSGVTLAHVSDRRPSVNVADAAKRDFETIPYQGDEIE